MPDRISESRVRIALSGGLAADASADAGAAARRFATTAAATGRADVAYSIIDSPLGALLVATTAHGLVRVAFAENDPDGLLEQMARDLSPRIVDAPAAVDLVRRQLQEYFEGRRREFGLTLDWALIGPFASRVLAVTRAIPYGTVMSYGEVAAGAGSPRGSRAAGNALGGNPIAIVIPCHRVLRSGGGLGGYGGGVDRKRWLLSLEAANRLTH